MLDVRMNTRRLHPETANVLSCSSSSPLPQLLELLYAFVYQEEPSAKTRQYVPQLCECTIARVSAVAGTSSQPCGNGW